MILPVDAWNGWLRKLASGLTETGRTAMSRRNRRRRPVVTRHGIEYLENRTLLSATLDSATGQLFVSGTSAADEAVVEPADVNSVRVVLNGVESVWPAANVQLIDFSGGSGNDRFENRTAIPARATGGDGDDTLSVASAPASLFGGLGNDVLTGGPEDDSLTGGPGDDTLNGGGGHDRVKGSLGDDQLSGGDGRDIIIGGFGRDIVNGGNDDDIVLGGHSEYDGSVTALDAIQATWTSTVRDYNARVDALTSGEFPLDIWQFGVGGNVYDDYEVDTVSGDAGDDLILAPADPEFDSLLDVLAIPRPGERILSPAYTSKPLAPGPQIDRPGYLETINDPTFGTPITRISGEVGAPLSLPALTETELFPAGEVWGPAIRNHYVTDNAWNVDGTLISLLSVGPRKYRLILGGDSTKSDEYLQPLMAHESEQVQYRWSQNPAKPEIQYGFPADHVTTNPVAPGSEDHLVYETNVLTGEVLRTIELPLNKLRTSKMTVAFVNGEDHVALIGRDRDQPNGPLKLYIVSLDAAPGESPVLTSIDIESGVTVGRPNPSTMRFSPDGQYAMFLYRPNSGPRSWRMFERGPNGTLRPHVQPSLPQQSFFAPGNPADGFFPVNWGHPIFAYDSQFNTHVVGSPYNLDDRDVPGIETFNNNQSRVGSLLSYNINTQHYRSLTDSTPAVPATPVGHVTATNHANPGTVVAVFGRAPVSGPSGQIVSINLDDPESQSGANSLLHHRSSVEGCYFCQPHPVLSPTGDQLIFSSTWGTHQGHISTFVADLAATDTPASSPVSFSPQLYSRFATTVSQNLVLRAGFSMTGDISRVQFFHDSNGSGALEIGIDDFIRGDSDVTDGWASDFNRTRFSSGDQTFFARAKPVGARWTDAISTTIAIPMSPDTESQPVQQAEPNATPAFIVQLDGSDLSSLTLRSSYTTSGAVECTQFFFDSNASGELEIGVDEFIRGDCDAADGWAATFPTVRFPSGQHTFFSRARPVSGRWTGPVSTVATLPDSDTSVMLAAQLTGEQFERLTLRATFATSGDFERVQFFHDVNNNGQLDVRVDRFIREDGDASDGWAGVFSTPRFSFGSQTFFARAKPAGARWSEGIATTIVIPSTIAPRLIVTPANDQFPARFSLEATFPTSGVISHVQYFRDVDGDGRLDLRGDDFLAGVLFDGENWSASVSTSRLNIDSSRMTFFARFRDASRRWSEPISAEIELMIE